MTCLFYPETLFHVEHLAHINRSEKGCSTWNVDGTGEGRYLPAPSGSGGSDPLFKPFQAAVFHFPHEADIAGGLVFIAAKMQRTVKDHPQELIGFAGLQVFCIVCHPLYADVYFGQQGFTRPGKGKTEDVGIEVMFEKLLVELQQIGIVAENDAQPAQFGSFPREQGPEIILQQAAMGQTAG